MRNSEKKGVSGLANAKVKPYRLIGGSHEHPILFGATALAKTVPASDYRDTSTYDFGLYGGVLAARLGFGFAGSEQLEAALRN